MLVNIRTYVEVNIIRKILSIFIIIVFFIVGCTVSKEEKIDYNEEKIDYKEEMKTLVKEISEYSKAIKEDFIVMIQNAEEVIYNKTETIDYDFLKHIDGIGKESLFFSHEGNDKRIEDEVTNYSKGLLNLYKENHKKVLVIDYCSQEDNIREAYNKCKTNDFVSFVANRRELDERPYYFESILDENYEDINSLWDVKNFLYLINPRNYSSKEELINEFSQSNYDLIIMDLFLYDEISFTKEEIERLKIKNNGGSRLIISYMSIGEAESYRYYWNRLNAKEKKMLINEENENWEENYLVSYWEELWKEIIIKNDDSYINRIINARFDGVYLDVIDAYEFYQQ